VHVSELEALAAAIDALADADPSTFADGDSVVELHRQKARLDAVMARTTAQFDTGREWEADGARTCATWVSIRCRITKAEARRRLRLGRALRHLPHAASAWLDGAITEPFVDVLARARTPETAEQLATDEAMLVRQARELRIDQFTRAVAYWVQLADPDGADRRAGVVRDGRRLHMSQTFAGAWMLDALLDPISGDIVHRALSKIEAELFEADWAAARAEHGDQVCAAHLARTPAQRRADALVELARRAMAVPADARLPEPLFTVVVGYETFAGRICELADGTVVAPSGLVPWLDRAWIERAVFDGPDRVVNVGVRRRLFEGGTRRAVQLQGRECFHGLCDETAEHCQVDHIQPHGAGGLTTTDNGRPACAYHNRLRHQPARPPP
jgi:hypothetical protein